MLTWRVALRRLVCCARPLLADMEAAVNAAFAAIVNGMVESTPLPPARGFPNAEELASWRAGMRALALLWREVRY